MALTIRDVRNLITRGDINANNGFDVLASIAHHGTFGDRNQARELLIRILDRRRDLPEALEAVLQSLLREHGLFPYLQDVDLYLTDWLMKHIEPHLFRGAN